MKGSVGREQWEHKVERFNSARGKEGDWSKEKSHRGDIGFPVNSYVSTMEPRRGCENGKVALACVKCYQWPLS